MTGRDTKNGVFMWNEVPSYILKDNLWIIQKYKQSVSYKKNSMLHNNN